MVNEATLEDALEGLLEDPDFPNRNHVRRLVPTPYFDPSGEEGVEVFVLTDETLLGDEFRFPMSVRIREAVAARLRSKGVEGWVWTRFMPENEFEESIAADESVY